MTNVNLKVKAGKDKEGKEYFEGTLSLTGVKPTKLTKGDGCTHFANKAGLLNAARNWAKKLNLELVTEEAKTEVKKAAKKSNSKKARKQDAPAAPTASTSCSESGCSPTWLCDSASK